MGVRGRKTVLKALVKTVVKHKAVRLLRLLRLLIGALFAEDPPPFPSALSSSLEFRAVSLHTIWVCVAAYRH